MFYRESENLELKTSLNEWRDYPLSALREAVINAAAHRDYNDAGNIQIRIFDDRLEVWSPGLLPKELDIRYLDKVCRSIPRNKVLVEIFHQLELIEGWGGGLQKIINGSIANGNGRPEFSEKAGAFVIAFNKRKKGVDEGVEKGVDEGVSEGVKNLSSVEVKILELIRENPRISKEDMQSVGNLGKKAVEYNVAKLKAMGVLKRIGPDKGGYWRISL